MGTASLAELRSIPLHPTKHDGVIDGYLSLARSCFDITITQGIAKIPPYASDDDLTRQVTPLKKRRLVHERSPVV
jgi:hypothetical protein